ncbi:PucR family transcriptional regulator [Niallia sp.]|uniref:PucR family transcriptional regulator n=1 Tax=Niallia sp. TaxID=2837523 RepID=UPI0028986FCE|nr:PucR family transcriptional regulator [Niallia sp.]
MSIKLEELLKLPSLREAKVVAGEEGLSKLVSSISVLEYTEVDSLKEDLFNNDEFYGSEIVISALIMIRDDVEAQCRTIEHLHKVGEIGLILYYVGVFLPKIDDKVIQLADRLGFTLIVMPEKEMSLRYSEVIYEVIEAIVKNDLASTSFVSEMVEQISGVPLQQRNMDTVLKILADRTRSSLVLANKNNQVIHAVTWPRTSTMDIFRTVEQYREMVIDSVHREERDALQPLFISKKLIAQEGIASMNLYMIKEKDPFVRDTAVQLAEVVQVFINLWGKHYDEISTAELMKAIMNDESVKMRRLANILNIDVSAIHMMWLVEVDRALEAEKNLLKVKEFVRQNFHVSLVDFYHQTLVILLDNSVIQEDSFQSANRLLDWLREDEESFTITICQNMNNTTDVQQAYLTCSEYTKMAKIIYPYKKILTLQEINFAAECFYLMNGGELAIEKALQPLSPIMDHATQAEELLSTLTVYLLEGNNRFQETADILYLHKNTIKYRIQRIAEILKYPVTKSPEIFQLYKAVAIYRMLTEIKEQ